MENATKALYMAAGTLIAILLLSLFVFAVNRFGGFAQRMTAQIEGDAIAIYNAKYYDYNGKIDITIQDVISIINLAKDSNDSFDYTKEEVISGGPYTTKVILKMASSTEEDVFAKLDDSTYDDNAKFKDAMNAYLSSETYNKWFYAVNVENITAEKNSTSGSSIPTYTLKTQQKSVSEDIKINKETGYVQSITITAINPSNYQAFFDSTKYHDSLTGKNKIIEYNVINKDYFKYNESL